MSSQGGVTILVTGGAGFLGQHIVKELLEQEEFPIKEVRTFDIQDFQWHTGIQPSKDSHKLYHVKGSICNAQEVSRACKDVDAVIHSCSCIAFGAFPNKKSVHAVNVTGTQNVVEGCIDNSIECLVYTSSMEVANDLTRPGINVTESSAVVPSVNPVFPTYSQTKYEAETIILAANNKELKNGKSLSTCSLRPCGIYGEGEHILAEHLSTYLKSGISFLIGEPTGKSQYAYAGNIAYSHMLAVRSLLWPEENKKVAGEAFFLGDDTPIESVGKLVTKLIEPLGCNISPVIPPYWLMWTIGIFLTIVSWFMSFFSNYEIPFHVSGVRYMYKEYTYSWEKLRTTFDYKPKYTYKESLDRSVAFYKHTLGIKGNKKQK